MPHISQDTINFVQKNIDEDVNRLALQVERYPLVDIPFALRQIAGRQQIRHKVPSWYQYPELIYPPHLSIEQCSSERTAKYKAQLCKGSILVDLTGGLGIDFYFMAKEMQHATYVEQQAKLVEIAKHNFNVLGQKNISIVESDAATFLKSMTPVDIIYIDPARRNTSGHKTVFIEDCTPNLIEIEELLSQKSTFTIIKLSPMLDITMALKSISCISNIHIVSCDNECKELLFIRNKGELSEPQYTCINLLNTGDIQSFSFSKTEEEEAKPIYTNILGSYLYEPNASILKAGAYKSLAKRFELQKLNKNSHLYTSDVFVEDFPGRKFAIKSVISPNKKEIKACFSTIKKANITVRNFPMTVDEIRKRTALKDGGEIYLFATTLSDDRKVFLICEKISL